ncbi:MAG: hypothetical protein ABSB63_03215 [Spirochaetia bacterium]|jgi:hypothetical protein
MQRRGITHRFGLAVLAAAAFAFAGCATTGAAMAGDKAMMKDEKTGMAPMAKAMDPMMSAHAAIDRFGSTAHLQMRDAMNHLPGPDAPVDFDKPPFVTTGLGPHGETVVYYNFDVQSTTPAPIYVLYRKGESDPVPGQLNIVDVVPGEPGYNDFWRINKVTVPPTYAANTIGSLQAIKDAGYAVEQTRVLVNCPIVPAGSTAAHRLKGSDTGLHMGWYRNKVVFYFNFSEAPLMVAGAGEVPVSPIYVTFNVNPDKPNGGPASGFKMKMGSPQTHNVLATLPGDMEYSPLWLVTAYDGMDFDKVMDLPSAMKAMAVAEGIATVNCPVFSIMPAMEGQ